MQDIGNLNWQYPVADNLLKGINVQNFPKFNALNNLFNPQSKIENTTGVKFKPSINGSPSQTYLGNTDFSNMVSQNWKNLNPTQPKINLSYNSPTILLTNNFGNMDLSISKQWQSNNPAQQRMLSGTANFFDTGIGKITGSAISGVTSLATDKLTDELFGDSQFASLMGNIFSRGSHAAIDTMTNNLIKGNSLTEGLKQNVGDSVSGAVAGIAGDLVGQGINALGGDSKLSRGIGQGVSTGIGMVGASALSNLLKGEKAFKGISDSFKAIKIVSAAKKAGNVVSAAQKAAALAGKWNYIGLGGQIIGSGLLAALGPSKEYGGKYGNITLTMDTIYDLGQTAAGFFGPVGMGVSGLMALNKGLSNVFGSTDGMCVCAGTKVFTATGDIVNIEDLLLEQGIIGWDENSHNMLPNTIVGIVEPRLKECLEIELKNGTILRCSIDHPILSNIKERAESHRINGKRVAYREWSFRRADELQVGNWVGLANNIDYWGTEEMPNAYLVGMLIGDGTYTYESSCKLWTADPSTWKYLEENNLAVLIGQYTPENSNGNYSIENRNYRIINGMQLVKDLGIAYLKGQEKTLPKNIGKYNKDSICKLIAGLYDTDGSFSVNEGKGVYNITLYQSNLELLENLKLILQKLGIFATIYSRKASINKMSNGRIINSNKSYRLELTDRNSIINFYKNIPLNIDYKKEHLEKIYKLVLPKLDKDHCDLSGAKLYKIVSIKHIGIQTVYNLEASKTHTYLANGIITHNTKQDAILGSAFMPAPVKWLNMAGAKSTGSFYNQSWQNTERTDAFMENAFGNLSKRFDLARNEAGKTYGTFSKSARKKAQRNLDFANNAWNTILAMTDLDELQRIRSLSMSSINNLRYALMIQGGFDPIYRGKQGMKIFNNATNHNIGMRLLSGAALIDDKQMILSALGGMAVPKKAKRNKYRDETDEPSMLELWKNETLEETLEEERRNTELLQHAKEEYEREMASRKAEGEAKQKEREQKFAEKRARMEAANTRFHRSADVVQTALLQSATPPFTGKDYQEAAEAQRQEKVEKFHEAEKIADATLMADLAVSAAPLLLRGFRWAFNKAGRLVKIPMNKGLNLQPNFGWNNGFRTTKPITQEEILYFIDNDIIPRLRAQGHKIEGYTPKIRTIDLENDLYDKLANEKSPVSNASWFSPVTDDITLRQPLEIINGEIPIHESEHALRYNILPNYKSANRKYLNEHIKALLTGSDYISDEAAEALNKVNVGLQLFNPVEAKKLRNSYRWIKEYFKNIILDKNNAAYLADDAILGEMGAINGLFRFNYSNYGKLTGEELNKAIDKIPEGFILRDLITESYTSPSINEMSKITGIPSDKLIYYGPDMLQDLALKFPKLKEIVLDVKDTMKSVGSYGVPLTVGGSTAATLYNTNK